MHGVRCRAYFVFQAPTLALQRFFIVFRTDVQTPCEKTMTTYSAMALLGQLHVCVSTVIEHGTRFTQLNYLVGANMIYCTTCLAHNSDFVIC